MFYHELSSLSLGGAKTPARAAEIRKSCLRNSAFRKWISAFAKIRRRQFVERELFGDGSARTDGRGSFQLLRQVVFAQNNFDADRAAAVQTRMHSLEGNYSQVRI